MTVRGGRELSPGLAGHHVEQQLEAMRQFKRTVLEAAQTLSETSGLDYNFDGTSEWVPWGQMTKVEKEMYPEAKDGGMFRVGLEVAGYLNL